MVNMRELHLEGNQIEDLSPLASMVNLQKLNMVGNNISDISPLYGLKNLKHLDLSDNDISEDQALEFSRRNPDCEFYLVSVDVQ
jgi:internalin A